MEKNLYRLEEFEKYALEKRKPFLDEKTWYMYIFATSEDAQGKATASAP